MLNGHDKPTQIKTALFRKKERKATKNKKRLTSSRKEVSYHGRASITGKGNILTWEKDGLL